MQIEIFSETRVPPPFRIDVNADSAAKPGRDVRQLDTAAQRTFIRFIAERAKARVAVKRFSASGSAADMLKAETALLEAQIARLRAIIAARDARDATLPMPRLILAALQVNMNAGNLPPAEDNGCRYLKIPLNALGGVPADEA